MEVEANRRHAGPSPFSRPPQPRPASTFARPAVAPREAVRTGATGEERKTLERQRRNGAQWFYWIAGLSLINAAIALAGQEWRFILGLGVTRARRADATRASRGRARPRDGAGLLVAAARAGPDPAAVHRVVRADELQERRPALGVLVQRALERRQDLGRLRHVLAVEAD